jgi:TRAP-type C4-dicarboxylate transport system substrate-binding protein
VFLVGAARWQSFSPAQQQMVREAARASYDHMNTLWAEFDTDMRAQVQRMGVTFTYPNKAPFMARAEVLKKEFAADAEMARLIGEIAGV